MDNQNNGVASSLQRNNPQNINGQNGGDKRPEYNGGGSVHQNQYEYGNRTQNYYKQKPRTNSHGKLRDFEDGKERRYDLTHLELALLEIEKKHRYELPSTYQEPHLILPQQYLPLPAYSYQLPHSYSHQPFPSQMNYVSSQAPPRRNFPKVNQYKNNTYYPSQNLYNFNSQEAPKSYGNTNLSEEKSEDSTRFNSQTNKSKSQIISNSNMNFQPKNKGFSSSAVNSNGSGNGGGNGNPSPFKQQSSFYPDLSPNSQSYQSKNSTGETATESAENASVEPSNNVETSDSTSSPAQATEPSPRENVYSRKSAQQPPHHYQASHYNMNPSRHHTHQPQQLGQPAQYAPFQNQAQIYGNHNPRWLPPPPPPAPPHLNQNGQPNNLPVAQALSYPPLRGPPPPTGQTYFQNFVSEQNGLDLGNYDETTYNSRYNSSMMYVSDSSQGPSLSEYAEALYVPDGHSEIFPFELNGAAALQVPPYKASSSPEEGEDQNQQAQPSQSQIQQAVADQYAQQRGPPIAQYADQPPQHYATLSQNMHSLPQMLPSQPQSQQVKAQQYGYNVHMSNQTRNMKGLISLPVNKNGKVQSDFDYGNFYGGMENSIATIKDDFALVEGKHASNHYFINKMSKDDSNLLEARETLYHRTNSLDDKSACQGPYANYKELKLGNNANIAHQANNYKSSNMNFKGNYKPQNNYKNSNPYSHPHRHGMHYPGYLEKEASMHTGISDGYGSCWEIKGISEIQFLQDTQQIGEGGFGKVFKGVWRGTVVAVKFMSSFQGKELDILMNLRHPNLLLFMGYCKNPPCIVTEFMAHGSLFDILHKSRTPFDLPLILRIAKDAATGMNFLHSLNPKIIHRDLKTGNILLDEHYRAKIADFGAAREQAFEMTHGTCTYSYSAPELLRNYMTYDEKVDIFSFGIILWEMLTRCIPYQGMSVVDIGYGIANQFLRPGEVPAQYPRDLRKLVPSCWDENPRLRPSFEDVISVLTRVEKSPEVTNKKV